MIKAVFVDKDGTLIKSVPDNIEPALITLDTNVMQALQQLHQQDYTLFMITNQPGIAHGYYSEADLHAAFMHINKLLRQHGVRLHGFYYCPHHPQGRQWPYNTTCTCRKPQPGMLFRAAEEYNIDLTASWMIGDILDDIEAGNRAGCKTILVDKGNETGWDLNGPRKPHYAARNLLDAAGYIATRTKYDKLVEHL